MKSYFYSLTFNFIIVFFAIGFGVTYLYTNYLVDHMLIGFISLSLIAAFMLTVLLPSIYRWQKKRAIESCIELMAEKEVVKHLPHFSILVFSIAVLVYYLSSDVLLFVFCLTLAITAYTDACTRWIPDPVIYALIAISVYSLNSKDFSESLYSVAFYVMPVLLLSLYGYVVKKESWIASGDYYVFLSIGLMLIPEYAAGTMLVTLAIMLILMRWVKQIPLVTVAYFTFTGFNICLFSGFL